MKKTILIFIIILSVKSLYCRHQLFDTPPIPKVIEHLICPDSLIQVDKYPIFYVLLNESGLVDSLKSIILTNSILDSIAVNHIKKQEFTPATYKGQPTSVWINFPCRFL